MPLFYKQGDLYVWAFGAFWGWQFEVFYVPVMMDL